MSTFLAFFLALITFGAWAQNYKYELQGSFATSAALDTMEPTTVNYTLNWNETSTALQGVYQDNYFTQKGPTIVTGTVSADGRTFTTILPQAVNEVKAITFATIETGEASGSVPIRIITRSNVNAAIDAPNTFALMSTRRLPPLERAPDNSTCIVGFGALTGYCGLYNGTMSEISDTRDRCNLLTAGDARFEMATDTSFNFYPNYVATDTTPAVHRIASFPPSPTSNAINLQGRVCASLPATSFVPQNCKTMNISGVFFEQVSTILFTGTYTISDDVNGDFCSYSLNLTREIPY